MRMPAVHLRFGATDHYLFLSLLAEFLGTALFQLLAATVSDQPLESAFALAAIMYAVKYVSGGHLNPAVSLAALLSGHIDYIRGFSYILVQILGAVAGAMTQAWISPDSAFGHTGPGCFAPVKELSKWGLFSWECVMTFLFIAVMYAALFVRPGHGDAAPLAAGLALFAALSTGGAYTGASPLNPARVFAGALVFKCFWGWAFVYISAQLTASLLAAGWAFLVFGKGDFYVRGGSATSSLRETLLGGNTAMGGAGEFGGGSTFAPTGLHYGSAGEVGGQPIATTGNM